MIEVKELKITSEKDVTQIPSFFKTQEQAGIIRVGDWFICGVYYKKDKWRFMFNDYTIYTLEPEDDLDRLSHQLKYWCKEGETGGKKMELTIFPDRAQMCFEIRTEVMNGCIDALTRTKFMYGDREVESNLPKIILEVKSRLGKVVRMTPGSEEIGVLVGVESTTEDYYYIYLTADSKLRFGSCVGGCKVLTQEEIPNELLPILQSPAEQRNVVYQHFSDPLSTSILVLSV